jgi:multisubunit Na+/H+ antiporter MnhE subunit
MARRTVGPRRSDSLSTYVRSTRIIGGISVLVLFGAVAWDLVDDRFWFRHTLFTALVASAIVVAVTVAVLNEVLERRQRERWSVLAQYALFDLVRMARAVWTGLLELTGLVTDEQLHEEALAVGVEVVSDTPRLATAFEEMLASTDRREELHRLIARLHVDARDVLGRWADVMVSSGTYAEIVDRHVELYSRLYWWGSVLDETDPLEEHLSRPTLSRVSPATQASLGPIEDEWLRDNLVAIAQLAESLDRGSFELAMRVVPLDWWAEQLPDRPSRSE